MYSRQSTRSTSPVVMVLLSGAILMTRKREPVWQTLRSRLWTGSTDIFNGGQINVKVSLPWPNHLNITLSNYITTPTLRELKDHQLMNLKNDQSPFLPLPISDVTSHIFSQVTRPELTFDKSVYDPKQTKGSSLPRPDKKPASITAPCDLPLGLILSQWHPLTLILPTAHSHPLDPCWSFSSSPAQPGKADLGVPASAWLRNWGHYFARDRRSLEQSTCWQRRFGGLERCHGWSQADAWRRRCGSSSVAGLSFLF